MNPNAATKAAAGLHVGLVAAAAYWTMRINNSVSLGDISTKEIAAIAGIAALPVLSAGIGLRLARGSAAKWLLAVGQTLALIAFAATFVTVLESTEAMAPLLFVLVSIWMAAALAVLLIVVWLVGRSARRASSSRS